MPPNCKEFWEISLFKLTMTQLETRIAITIKERRMNNQGQLAASGHGFKPRPKYEQGFGE